MADSGIRAPSVPESVATSGFEDCYQVASARPPSTSSGDPATKAVVASEPIVIGLQGLAKAPEAPCVRPFRRQPALHDYPRCRTRL